MMRRTSGRRPRATRHRRFVPTLNEALERREVLSTTPIVSGLAATTTTLTSSVNPTLFNGGTNLTVKVVAPSGTPTGSVTIFDNGKALLSSPLNPSGVYSAYVDQLGPGTHTLTVSYTGDTNDAPSTSTPLTQTVGKASPSVNLTATASPGAFGDLIILQASVGTISLDAPIPAATGTITFYDGTTVLGTLPVNSPYTTFPTSLAVSGTHQFSARYSGDANYIAATSVNAQQASTTALASPSPSLSQLVATVAAPPGSGVTPTGGQVSFYDGGTLLGSAPLVSGVATFTPPVLAPGNHALSAIYSGGFQLSPSVSALNVVAPKLVTQMTLTPSSATINANTSVTFTTALTFPSIAGQTIFPTGAVSFYDGTSLLGSALVDADGVATYTSPPLGLGSHSIIAKYTGTSLLQAVNSSPLIINAGLAGTSVTLSGPTGPFANGQWVPITVTVKPGAGSSGTPTGAVEFFDGTTALGTTTLSGGTATFIVHSLPVGTQSITARYLGDTSFASSVSTASKYLVGNANELYLNQLYLDLLDRPIDPVGLAGWEAQLNAGVARASVILSIESSPEFALTTLADLSHSLTGTAPTAAEQAAALQLQGQNQANALTLEAIILNSPGFYQTQGGGTNAGFVAAAGLAATGQALPSSQAASLLALANAGNRPGAVTSLLSSPSTYAYLVNSDYLRFLSRPAETAGLQYFTAQLQANVSPNLISAQFLASPEYYLNAST